MAETEKMQGSNHILYVGIDLGTSRTSISASNGMRESIASYVGYPKDVVSFKLLQRDAVYGAEALEKRLSLNLHRPLARGVIRDDNQDTMKAAADLLGEIVRRAGPRDHEKVYAVLGTPAQASIKNKETLLNAASRYIHGVMLCSEPFAVAYGLGMLDDTLVIDIGAGTTDLCRMHGTMPEDSDQITSTYAGDSIDEMLAKMIREKYPEAQFTTQMIKAIKEKHSNVAQNMPQVMVNFPVRGKPTPFDITVEVYTSCRSIIPSIVEGISQLIATFDPEFQDKLKNRVLLSGGGSQIKGLDSAIEVHMQETLGSGRVVRVEEPVYGGANGALKIACDMPGEYWEELH